MSFSTRLELVSLTIHPLAYHWGEGHNYTVGITPFADLTRSEFRSRYGAPQQNARHKHTDSLRHPADFGRFSGVFLEENQSHRRLAKGRNINHWQRSPQWICWFWAFEIYQSTSDFVQSLHHFFGAFHIWVPVVMRELLGWQIFE